MKSVLISIQPKWCELIASGKKTVEVRKTRPKIDVPFKCYIYCTQGKEILAISKYNDKSAFLWKKTDVDKYNADMVRNGKVIGEFVCDCIANYEAELWDDDTFERIQEFFEPDDFAEYGEYEYKTIADNGDDFWKENMLCQASCLTIEELRKYVGCGIATFYGWHISNLVIYDEPKGLGEFYVLDDKAIKECEHRERIYVNPDSVNGAWLKGSYICTKGEEDWCSKCKTKPITRPPQSWCYADHPTEKGGAE